MAAQVLTAVLAAWSFPIRGPEPLAAERLARRHLILTSVDDALEEPDLWRGLPGDEPSWESRAGSLAPSTSASWIDTSVAHGTATSLAMRNVFRARFARSYLPGVISMFAALRISGQMGRMSAATQARELAR